jgi:uncharacterized membrane protein YiaA
MNQKPSNAFVAASWIALLAGMISFIIGLWNADMLLNEKGYYFTVLMFGLFAAISLQKSVRDQLEGIAVYADLLRPVLVLHAAGHCAANGRAVECHTNPK